MEDNSYQKLLLENKAWSKGKVDEDPHYFERLVNIQKPEFLWIGCSDSRVPANEITGTEPGEIFVHRNVGNLVLHTDLNMLSVLQYAVENLGVKHVIVCGHYGCGGVQAAFSRNNLGIINKWLRNIKDVYKLHSDEISLLPDDESKVSKLVELNVKEQVLHLAETSIIQKAWRYHNRPHLHGLVYDLHDGLLRPIVDMPDNSPIDPIYEYDNL